MCIAKALQVLRAIGQVLAFIVFATLLLLFRPISWALALLFVLLCLGALANSLSIWPAVACFAALVGQHLIIQFYPLEPIVRRWGPQKRNRT